jgi:hypothetical protein
MKLQEAFDLIQHLEDNINHDCKVTLTREKDLLVLRVDAWFNAEKYSVGKIIDKYMRKMEPADLAVWINAEFERAMKI